MKKIFLTVFSLITLNLFFAQTNCDDLLKKNKLLRAQLGYKSNKEMSLKGISKDIKIEIIDCIGSTDQQIVTIKFPYVNDDGGGRLGFTEHNLEIENLRI